MFSWLIGETFKIYEIWCSLIEPRLTQYKMYRKVYSKNRDIGGILIFNYIWLIMLWGYWMNWSGPVIQQTVYGTQWPRTCNESVHSWLLVCMECRRGLWREIPSCQELFLSQWCDGMCVTSPEAEMTNSRRNSMQVSAEPGETHMKFAGEGLC